VLAYHNNSIPQALSDLFPDIGLSPSLFLLPCKYHLLFFYFPLYAYLFNTAEYRDIRSRRRFFDDYANTQKFDPRKPENWYSQNIEKLTLLKVFIYSLSPFLSLSLSLPLSPSFHS